MATMVESRELWNPFSAASKANLLGVVREEADGLLELASDPSSWECGTAAGHWQVRDVVGHMVDVTEAYLERFAGTRAGSEVPPLATLREMPRILDDHATAFRSSSQEEMVARLRSDLARVMGVFEGLTESEWTGLNVTHGYMGPIPAFFYPTFQLVDYAIHGWDIREGLRIPHAMFENLMFGRSAVAVRLNAADTVSRWTSRHQYPPAPGNSTVGSSPVFSRNTAYTFRTASGVTFEPGTVDDLPAVLEFDPASLVLTAYGRMRGGTACGDRVIAARFSGLFHAI